MASFWPELPKPDFWEASLILHEIYSANRVVEIPGYHSFREFSADWEDLLVRFLSAQQIQTAVNVPLWAQRAVLEGPGSDAALAVTMDRLFHTVKREGRIAYVLLQMSGPAMHSWLVIDMQAYPRGYFLRAIDSAEVGNTIRLRYRRGDRSLQMFSVVDSKGTAEVASTYGEFSLHLSDNADFERYDRAIAEYCAS